MTLPSEDLSVRTVVLPNQLTGPVRYDWLAQAARVAGRTKGLHLACALAWLAALHGRPDVALTRRTMARWSLSRDIVGKALASRSNTSSAVVFPKTLPVITPAVFVVSSFSENDRLMPPTEPCSVTA